MKRTLIALLAVAAGAHAQTQDKSLPPLSTFHSSMDAAAHYPTGFSDIPWGAGVDQAKATMLNKPGVTMEPPNGDGTITFSGGTFAGSPASSWKLRFRDGRLDMGEVKIRPNDLKKTYSELKRELTNKYRKASREEFGGGIHYATYWEYATKEGSWLIVCDINTDGVTVKYEKRQDVAPVKSSTKDL